jgi:hypothetical protein
MHSSLGVGDPDFLKHQYSLLNRSAAVDCSMTLYDVYQLTANRNQGVKGGFRVLNHKTYFASPDPLQLLLALLQKIDASVSH